MSGIRCRFHDDSWYIMHWNISLTGNAAKIISEIKRAGFDISAMEMFSLERANAEEFLEIYKGVLQEYKGKAEATTVWHMMWWYKHGDERFWQNFSLESYARCHQ